MKYMQRSNSIEIERQQYIIRTEVKIQANGIISEILVLCISNAAFFLPAPLFFLKFRRRKKNTFPDMKLKLICIDSENLRSLSQPFCTEWITFYCDCDSTLLTSKYIITSISAWS